MKSLKRSLFRKLALSLTLLGERFYLLSGGSDWDGRISDVQVFNHSKHPLKVSTSVRCDGTAAVYIERAKR